ncbi:12378_t:CDS:2 [Acaulospora morrowiae]|uniref:12378_t:CDS:1 n=1 Tax=Acaulospora morrowiae TaxID=94023 RepID=A0A9N8WK34_9GLOM|nr:12378_t:CDS:2 [Acaulospora morrowiae]
MTDSSNPTDILNIPSTQPDNSFEEKGLRDELVANSESEVDIMREKVDSIKRETGVDVKGKAKEVEEFEKIEDDDINSSENLPIQSSYNSDIDIDNLNSKGKNLELVENSERVKASGEIVIEDGNSGNIIHYELYFLRVSSTSTNSTSTTAFTTPSLTNTIPVKPHPIITQNTSFYDHDYQDDEITAEPSSSRSRNVDESMPIGIEFIEDPQVPYIPSFEEAYGFSPYEYEYYFIGKDDFEDRTFRTYGARFKNAKSKNPQKQEDTRDIKNKQKKKGKGKETGNKMSKYFCGIRIKNSGCFLPNIATESLFVEELHRPNFMSLYIHNISESFLT